MSKYTQQKIHSWTVCVISFNIFFFSLLFIYSLVLRSLFGNQMLKNIIYDIRPEYQRLTHPLTHSHTSAMNITHNIQINRHAYTMARTHIGICLRTAYKRYLLHSPCDVMIFIYIVEYTH